MRRLLEFVVILSVACIGVCRDANAEEACYEIAVVGRIVESSNFVPLDQLVADPDADSIYIGGRLDLRVRVTRVLLGDNIPRTLDVRAIMTSLPTPASNVGLLPAATGSTPLSGRLLGICGTRCEGTLLFAQR